MSSVSGRVRHYGTFYGLPEMAGDKPDRRPTALIYGNCQAEAVRVLLAGSKSTVVQTFRVPPVFELTGDDIVHLRRIAARCQFLISQPVTDDYRGLPLGTAQVAAMMRPGSSVIRWPVVRYSGLHPYQSIVRDPRDPARDPPVVPYHDLRTLASARTGLDQMGVTPSVGALREVGLASAAELRRREQQGCDVVISDVLGDLGGGDMATINHPGNRVLIELAHRVQAALGGPPDAGDPGRALLGDVVAPVDRPTLRALGMPGRGHRSWTVHGRSVRSGTVHGRQWRWYLENPWMIEAGHLRHGATMDLLGLR